MLLLLLKCYFTSTGAVGVLGTGAQDVRLEAHTVAEFCFYRYKLFCAVMWRLCSAMMSFLNNSIHPREMEINSPKTACRCPCDGVIIQFKNNNGLTRSPESTHEGVTSRWKYVTHEVRSSYGMKLSLYKCTYRKTPRVLNRGRLQQQQRYYL